VSDVPPEARIGLLSSHAGFYGGGQRSLRDLAIGLRCGPYHPVAILPAGGALGEALREAAVDCLPLDLPSLRRAAGAPALAAVRRLATLVKRERIALLHSDAPRPALYAGLAARLTGIPHVWHVRSSRCSRLLSDRVLLALCDGVIAVSRAAAGRSRSLRRSIKVRVVPTGIPPFEPLSRTAARERLGLPQEAYITAVVGRIERDKGGDRALAALARVRTARPGALLVFVGREDPGDPWPHTLRVRAAALGLSGAVRFAGELPQASTLLPAFDLLLHPSRHEALPRVVIEALAAAVPVLATAVGGVEEIIEHASSGWLVPPREVDRLADAALRLATDDALRARLAAAGPARARQRFSIEAMLLGITTLYEQLLARREEVPGRTRTREVTS
jgi:glycosyltransferase involved in cell wall biosynthesis